MRESNLENRSVPYRYRGPLLIHAGAKRVQSTDMPRGVSRPEAEELVLGAVIGVVDVVDVVDRARSKWFQGPYALVLEKPRALKKPVPWSGQLGLWTPPPGLARAVRLQLK